MNLSILPLKEWGLPVKDFFLSAGPCSAESEEQLLEIADKLTDCSVSFLRAGIWKPRTRPGNFEGVGALGLKWLQKAKEETGMPKKAATRWTTRAPATTTRATAAGPRRRNYRV